MHGELFEDLTGEISVERSIDLSVPPDSVWQHLTDGDLLGDWMEGEVEITARPGGSITLLPEEGDLVWGTVEEVIPGKRLQWSWRTDEGMPTQVEIEIGSAGEGTTLSVRETLLPWTTTGLPPQWVDPPSPMAFLSAAA